MKTLYDAANSIEAHLLIDLLKQDGIDAHIFGEHLQGAIGELPMAGLIKLMVQDSDYPQAKQLVEQWCATKVEEPTASSVAQQKSSSWSWSALLIGLCLGVGGAYAAFNSPVTHDGIDHDKDGRLDEKWTFSPIGRMTKNEVDRNFDGKADYIVEYDLRGQQASALADDNFDGVFETKYRFRQGNIEISEVDTDGDGYFDLVTFYENGVPSYTEFLNPATGRVLRLERYKFGKLVSADIDTDTDGVLDTRHIYGKLAEIIKTETITK
jgi:Putative prokaryotic signal transducing protein